MYLTRIDPTLQGSNRSIPEAYSSSPLFLPSSLSPKSSTPLSTPASRHHHHHGQHFSPAPFALTRSLTHFLRHNQPPLLLTYLAQASGNNGRLVCYESVFLQVLHSIGVSQCLLIYLHRLKGFPLLLINVAQAVENFEPSLVVQIRFNEVL